MADTDQRRFAEAVRRTIEANRSAAHPGADAIQEAVTAIGDMETKFREAADRAVKRIERGAHLARNRIVL